MSNGASTVDLEWIESIVRFIFSWLIMIPISVIISGKLLIRPIRFGTDTKQLLRIPLKIFVIEATGGEVILGFTGLLITFFFVAVLGGKNVYEIVKTNFGIDPGHFYSVVLFAALMTVIWSTIIFLIHLAMTKSKSASFVENSSEYEKRILRLSSEDNKNE